MEDVNTHSMVSSGCDEIIPSETCPLLGAHRKSATKSTTASCDDDSLSDVPSDSMQFERARTPSKDLTTRKRWRDNCANLGRRIYEINTWVIEDSESTMGEVEMVINLVADLAPAGMLTISFAMVGTGYIPGLLMLVGFMLIASYMMYIISDTLYRSGTQSFIEVWESYLGVQTAWIPACTIFIVCFGCSTAYACMLADLISGCTDALGYTWIRRSTVLITLAVFPLLPLCCMKDLSSLAPTSLAGIIASCFLCFLMILRMYDGTYMEGGIYFSEAPPPETQHVMNFGPRSLLLANELAIAYMCHYNGAKYYRELNEHGPRKFGILVLVAFILGTIFFGIAMVAGYSTFGALSDAVILNNYSRHDTLSNVARISMGFANLFSFPLMFSGLRENAIAFVDVLFPNLKSITERIVFQNGLCIFLLACVIGIAVAVKDARLVLGLVGSSCGAATIYIIPSFLYDRCLNAEEVEGNGKYPLSVKIVVRSTLVGGIVVLIGGVLASIEYRV